MGESIKLWLLGIKKSKKKLVSFLAIVLGSFALLLTSIVFIAGIQAIQIKDHMTHLLEVSKTLASSFSAGEPQNLQSELVSSAKQVSEDVSATNQFSWRVAQAIPFIGENFKAVRTSLTSIDMLINEVALPALPIAEHAITGEGLFVNGGINAELLNEGWNLLASTQEELEQSEKSLNEIPLNMLLPQVKDGVVKLSSLIHSLSSASKIVNSYQQPINSLIGVQGPKNYLIVFQNPAEMRPLGGLPGAFAMITVDKGSISVGRQTSASTSIYEPQLSDDFKLESSAREFLFHENANRIMAQAMNTTSFSEAAQRISGHWSRAFPEQVDGVLALDPVVLGYFLEAFGPLYLDSGIVLDQNNLSSYLLNEAYKLTDSNEEQDLLYAEVVTKFVEKFKQGPVDPIKIVEAFKQGTSESRILFWSPAADENELAKVLNMQVETPVSSADKANVGVYFMFAQGAKIYYFLNQSVTVSSTFCDSTNTQEVSVHYTLKNTLSDEEANTLATSIWAVSHVKPKGAILSQVLVYGPPDSSIVKVAPQNPQDTVGEVLDGKNPVSSVETLLAPGGQGSVEVSFSFASNKQKEINLYVTPLSHPTKSVVEYKKCKE